MRSPGSVGGPGRRPLAVGRGQEVDEAAKLEQRLDIVLEGEVGDPRPLAMGERAAELLMGDVLMGDRAHHIRPGHEHVGAVLDHEDEVGHRRRIDRPARAGAHDQGDLRHHPGRQDVALEHLGIAGERGHPLLDPRPAGIVDPDDGRADLHGLVHDLADLLGMGLAQRAAEDGEVLAEDEDQPAVDGAMAGHHPIARDLLLGHAEIRAAMLDEHVPFLEGAGIQQQLDALPGGQPSLGMLGLDALDAAAGARRRPFILKSLENFPHGSL